MIVAPGTIEKVNLGGTMYGGYTSDKDSLLDFRLLEWKKPFTINPQHRGFFDLSNGQYVTLPYRGIFLLLWMISFALWIAVAVVIVVSGVSFVPRRCVHGYVLVLLRRG